MNHDLKSLATMWSSIALQRHAHPSTVKSCLRRCFHRNFFFIDLPLLGKALDAGLESGFYRHPDNCFKQRAGTVLPVFLNEFFFKVFEKDGTLRYQPCIESIRSIRQLCYLFYKLDTTALLGSTFDPAEQFIKFKERDASVKTTFTSLQLFKLRNSLSIILQDFDASHILGRHSAGATADRFSNLEKRTTTRFDHQMIKVFGAPSFFLDHDHLREHDEFFSESVPSSARVAFVPKDSRGPRVICMEPHERMFLQQGLMDSLYYHIENNSVASGYVNFTDQTINQELARIGSIDKTLSTIDLKDASDMISWALVEAVFPPDVVVALRATRSSSVSFNDETVALNKFAPMGSALCFPIEALVFFAICRTVTDVCWVYGDDIVVRTSSFDSVIDALESYGLIINRQKSLSRGHFRESCGAEYYDGHDISCLKLKSLDPINFISFCNNVTTKYDSTMSESLIRIHEDATGTIVPRSIPMVLVNGSPAIKAGVFYTHNTTNNILLRRRWNKNLQRYEYRCLLPVSKLVKSQSVSDRDRLYEYYLSVIDRQFFYLGEKYQKHGDHYFDCLNYLSPRERIEFTSPGYGYVWAELVDFSTISG